MKRLLTMLVLGGLLLTFFGCSESPVTTAPNNSTQQTIAFTERPQFIETRPEAVRINYELKAPLVNMIDKKPPPPPPDTLSDDPNPNPPHKYAYVVGISDYEGTINDLQYCDDDAVEMKAMLQGEGFTVMMDLDLHATADNITAGLQWLVSNADPGDEIAFCYSGHGGRSTAGSALISTDLYYVTHGYVMNIFNGANCTKKLLTIDACVVGDFHDDCEDGTMMATASDKSSSYDAPTLENGAWTYYFLEAVNDVGLIYAEDVATYAEDEMKAWAKPYHIRVTPTHTDKYTGKFDI